MKLFSSASPVRLPLRFSDPQEGAALVREKEKEFDDRLSAAARCLCAEVVDRGVRVIRLSGPSCAGKTTTAHKLTAELEAAGRVVYPISIDDFFYSRDRLEAMAQERGDGRLDYDSVAAIDLSALASCVGELLEGGHTRIPVFDFVAGEAREHRELRVAKGEEPVFLFEGIQAVYPEVAALFDGVSDRSIFINVMRETVLVSPQGEERVFSPEDIRLLRRLVRDEAKRGASPDLTLTLWHSVRDNEERSIYPYAPACDWGIDSNMGFDVHMLAPHLRRIFAEKPCDGEEAAEEKEILASLEGVEGISSACLGGDSLYHEFILT